MVPVQVTRMRKAAKIKMQKVILRYAHICADVFFFVITLLNKMNDSNLWGGCSCSASLTTYRILNFWLHHGLLLGHFA